MFLNRYGLVDPDLVEGIVGDERLRRLERQAAVDPGMRGAYHRELVRRGQLGKVMSALVAEHAKASQEYDRARKDRKWGGEAATNRLLKARHAVRTFHREHGVHPPDHAHRGENESPSEFAERLADLEHGHSWRSGSGDHSHGTISYDIQRDDPEGYHYARRDAMERAWKREVPGGHVSTGDRSSGHPSQGDYYLKGSYIHFLTSPNETKGA